jgi:ABC-type antimicrobial peptide transport system permease subunit
LALEANLFSEYPFRFEFPSSIFFTVIILSLLVTLLASYLPARVLLKKRIASALKGK